MSIQDTDGGRSTVSQKKHWQDWCNLALAIWLFLSPWVLNFGGAQQGFPPSAAMRASWNAWILGVVIFVVAAAALSRLEPWQEIVNLLLGAWVFIAPWILGFAGIAAAMWDHLAVGALVFILAVWDLQTVP